MYVLKKIGKVLTSKSVGTGPSSYEKRIYRAAVSQRLRNTGIGHMETMPERRTVKKFSLNLRTGRPPTGVMIPETV